MGSRESGLVCFGPITGAPCSLSGSSEQDWSKGGVGVSHSGVAQVYYRGAVSNGITQPKLKSLWHTAHRVVIFESGGGARLCSRSKNNVFCG